VSQSWTVIVPVKRFVAAKSRLDSAAANRQRLARAFALDTLSACRETPGIGEVIVVSRTRLFDSENSTFRWVRDPGGGINAALMAGSAASGHPSPMLALLSDLPCIRSTDIALILRLSTEHPRAFLSDLVGTGSTALAVTPGSALDPRFGPRSRAAHRISGAVELTHPGLVRARRDVDTQTDLADAIRLGLGPESTTVVRDL
jgi:2-phospho-L-lactate guanylyltransferase